MLMSQRIEKIKLSPNQKIVMEYIFKLGRKIESMTVKDIAEGSFTSTGTVMRLTKKIGYNGYDDFKKDFIHELDYLDSHFSFIDSNYPFESTESFQSIANKIITLKKDSLEDTLHLIEHDSLQKATLLLNRAENIYLFAFSSSLLLAQTFQLNMMRIGKKVITCSVKGDDLYLANIATNRDCALFVSYSGETQNLSLIAETLFNKQVPIITITGLGENSLTKYSQTKLYVSTREKLYSKIAGFINEESIKAVLDILYSTCYSIDYDKNKNIKAENSRKSEPGRTSNIEIMKEST